MIDKRYLHDDGPKLGCYDPYGDFGEEAKVS
jgi:hypothetical protein